MLKTMYPPQKDSPSTFLLGDISTVDTLITVANAASLPTIMPYPLTIGVDKTVTETVMVTATNLGNNQLTVTRGNPVYAWTAGSKVARVLTAKDFKDVQDNITDINNALTTAQETIATNANDISTLKSTVGDVGSGLVKGAADEVTRAKAAETAEVSRASAAENLLTSGKINRTELAQVITDWVYSADGTELLVTINRYNASTQQATQYTRTLPIVSSEAMGIMTPEAYNEITALRNDVNALTNLGGRFIGLSFATKAALTSYVVPASVKTGDFTYVLDDETKSNSTTRYVRNGSTWDFTFVIDYDPVGLANATTPGIVKSDSGSTDGKVFVEVNGTMSVVGWSNVVKTNDIRLTDSRTPKTHKSTHATGQPDALTPADIGALATNGAGNSVTVAFTAAGSRVAMATGETLATIMGKILRWLSDLGTAAFKNIPTSGNAATSEVVIGSDTRLTDARSASDVYAWAKASTKPAYNASDVGALASDTEIVTVSDEIPGMSTYIKTLKDKLGNVVLPRTRTTAITMGDGTTTLEDALNAKMNSNIKGVANGVASLGEDSKVPAEQLPVVNPEDTNVKLTSAVLTALGLTGSKYVSDALTKLSGSALRKVVPTYISEVPTGTEITLNETISGTTTAVTFIKVQDNYQSSGRTLLIRKATLESNTPWHSINYNNYPNSDLDTFLNTTYISYLDASIRSQLANVNVPCLGASTDGTFATFSSALTFYPRKCFALSCTEIGSGGQYSEGTSIPYFNSDAKRASTTNSWLRTPYNSESGLENRAYHLQSGGQTFYAYISNEKQTRPAFTLPATYPMPGLDKNSLVDMSGNLFLVTDTSKPTIVTGTVTASSYTVTVNFASQPKLLAVVGTNDTTDMTMLIGAGGYYTKRQRNAMSNSAGSGTYTTTLTFSGADDANKTYAYAALL